MSHEKFIFYTIEYLLKTEFGRKSINYSRSESSRESSSKGSSSREQSVAAKSVQNSSSSSLERQSPSFRFSKFFQSSELPSEFSYEQSPISSFRPSRPSAPLISINQSDDQSFNPLRSPRLSAPPRSFTSPSSFPSLNQSIKSPGTDYDRELANLTKLYSDDAKYSEENDNFSFKLIIFHDMCARVDVSHSVKMKTFLIMLKDLALDFYYSNMSISTLNRDILITFDEVCYSMSNYFESAEYKRSILTR